MRGVPASFGNGVDGRVVVAGYECCEDDEGCVYPRRPLPNHIRFFRIRLFVP